MSERRIESAVAGLGATLRRWRIARALAWSWGLAAAVGAGLWLLQWVAGRPLIRQAWGLPLGLGAVLAVAALVRETRRNDRPREVIRALEPDHPELLNLWSAASEQEADPAGGFGFLQQRVIEEALAHPRLREWPRELDQRLGRAQALNALMFFLLAVTAIGIARGARSRPPLWGPFLAGSVAVTPGDTAVERGTGLVIAAKFDGVVPNEVTLVLHTESGKESRIPMARRLADPIFGASLLEVSEAGVYQLEYGGQKTREYRISVFEFPALVRADAALTYPSYTHLTNRVIRDTLRVSAVEGSRLTYTLQLNKPVVRARWLDRNHPLSLTLLTNAVAVLPEFPLTNSTRYALELVDAEGRTNKFPTEFVLQALTNQRPDLRLVFPRGDTRVSRLEELQLEAEASDDFGLLRYGVGFGVAGQEPQFVELGQAAPGRTRRHFEYLVPLESLAIEPEQALVYFAWADDDGPDGQPRRTFSDMFFAEVRPFEEIFRNDQSGESENQSQSQGGQGGGNQRTRLADLQKQIVIATWKLQQEKEGATSATSP